MKNRLLVALKMGIFLALGLFLVWFALKDLDAQKRAEMKSSFVNANYFWVLLSLGVGVFSHLSRAMRWKNMLEALGHKPKLKNTFFAVMVGYLANYAPVPRLGEASRCGLLTRYGKIPFTESFGTVVAERLVDVLCLMVVFIITFFLQVQKINSLAHEYVLDPLATKWNLVIAHPLISAGVVLILAAGFWYFLKLRKKSGKGIVSKIVLFMSGFYEGLKTVKNVKNPWAFWGHSIFIWVSYYVSLQLCFRALPETSGLGLSIGLPIFALGTLGVVFTPGGIGLYQIIVTKVMLLFLISVPVANAFPWIVWTSQFLFILTAGLLSLILLPILNKEENGNTNPNAS
ncbi:MAG: lysylphosphatidylglycerol synthase transmembrane domain-containing protein [Bacteroidia bacterium]